jgi:hypothetical protein
MRERAMKLPRQRACDPTTVCRRAAWSLLLFLCWTSAAQAQASKGKNLPDRPPRPPSFEDVRYGPHDRNVLDLYLATKERMDKAGVECGLHFREDYAGAGPDAALRMSQDQVRFFLEHFPKP